MFILGTRDLSLGVLRHVFGARYAVSVLVIPWEEFSLCLPLEFRFSNLGPEKPGCLEKKTTLRKIEPFWSMEAGIATKDSLKHQTSTQTKTVITLEFSLLHV